MLTASRPVAGAAEAELVEAVTAAREVRRLPLGPLSEAAVAAIMAARLGGDVDGDLLRAGWEATAGNPFLCETLASAIAEGGRAAPPEKLVEAAARESSSLVVARLRPAPRGRPGAGEGRCDPRRRRGAAPCRRALRAGRA